MGTDDCWLKPKNEGIHFWEYEEIWRPKKKYANLVRVFLVLVEIYSEVEAPTGFEPVYAVLQTAA